MAFILCHLLLLLSLLESATASKDLKCEEISIPLCKGIGYNLTYMPNMFNQANQEEAGLEIHQFWPLVEIKCSHDLKFFLCSIYAPICEKNYDKELPPCRSVCERARSGCAPIMKQYGFSWPEKMNCENFPVLGDEDTLCMGHNISSDSTSGNTPTAIPGSTNSGKNGPDEDHKQTCSCQCNEPFVYIPDKEVTSGDVPLCGLPCNRTYFSKERNSFAAFWIGLWAILCFLCTFVTVSTFFVDMERLKYPERPIIFLSACYLMVSIGYILRFIAGHQSVACNKSTGLLLYTFTKDAPALCTITFLLIYYFGMASSLWWVILTFTWFLAAAMKWSTEAICNYSQYFHIICWTVPSLKTIAILAMKAVDADPLSGICYVGNHDLRSLAIFVLIPLSVFLLFGTSFLVAGFVSLFRIREVMKHGGAKIDKLEQLMIRIGVFSVLYTVPVAVVVGCNLYELANRTKWEKAINCDCSEDAKPDYSIFIIKYFMSLVIGITSGFWIWSGKTIESWRKFLCRSQTPKRHELLHRQKCTEINV